MEMLSIFLFFQKGLQIRRYKRKCYTLYIFFKSSYLSNSKWVIYYSDLQIDSLYECGMQPVFTNEPELVIKCQLVYGQMCNHRFEVQTQINQGKTRHL